VSRTSRSVPVDPATRRRWSASRTRLTAVGLVLVAGFALSGCSESKAGAAATVGGDRIEISTLNAKVNHLEQAYEQRNASLAGTTAQLNANQAGLVQMIYSRIVDEAAARIGVSTNATQVLAARRQVEAQLGGPEALQNKFLQNMVLPDEIDDVLRSSLLRQGIAKARGINPAAPDAPEQIDAYLTEVANSMKIKLNPRYGAWDPATLSTKPAVYGWLSDSPTAVPAGV
jgi:outer membrane murein-binding lipoprotein Lpp